MSLLHNSFFRRIILVVVNCALIIYLCMSSASFSLENGVGATGLLIKQHPMSPLNDGQGIYESCSPAKATVCLRRLQQIAEAGFALVINYDQFYATRQQELVYAQKANALHIKIIWAINNPVFWNGTNLLSYYRDLSASCVCSDNQGFISYVVSLVKNLPTTWGYYIGDEVKVYNHRKVKFLASLVKRLDPVHPRLFIASGEDNSSSANIATFADSADVIGDDIYPIGTAAMSISRVGYVAASVQKVANAYGKQAVMVLQSFSWAEYSDETWRCVPFPACASYPDVSQMRIMLNLVLANSHPRLILWYSFFDIMRSDSSVKRWHNLILAAEPMRLHKN